MRGLMPRSIRLAVAISVVWCVLGPIFGGSVLDGQAEESEAK
jgi:hypothetical protein